MEISDFKKIIFDCSKRINESMNIAFHFLGEKYGITVIQLRILMEINRNGSHTIGTLADAVNMAGANISTMCKKLEKQGVVKRIRDKSDERVVRIELTDLGENLIQEIDHYVEEKISRALSDESDKTFQIITAGMEQINSLLQKMGRDEKH